MHTDLWIYSIVILVTSLAGALLPILIGDKDEKYLKWFISLGGGILLGMAFIHMIPESSELLSKNQFGLFLFIGFSLLFVLERFVMVHACEEHGCHYHTVGTAAFAGLAVHGLIEGFALASSSLTSNIGPIVLIAIISHKAPGAIALSSLLKLAGKSSRQILLYVTGVGLSGGLGILLAVFAIKTSFFSSTAGIFLALSAGTFVYIGACDIIPELHRTQSDKLLKLFFFFGGALLSILSGWFLH